MLCFIIPCALQGCPAFLRLACCSYQDRAARPAIAHWSQVQFHWINQFAFKGLICWVPEITYLLKWVRYCTASLVIKTIQDKNPCRLHSLLRSSYFEEPRKIGIRNFLISCHQRLVGNLLTANLITYDLLIIPWAVKTCLTIQYVFSWKTHFFPICSIFE